MTDEIKRCGSCFHGKLLAKDMTRRICKGGPPQSIVLPSNQAPGFQVQNVYPNVGATDEACGVYKPKIVLVSADRPE